MIIIVYDYIGKVNIFILDEDPQKAAQYLCNKHLGKMLIESAQLLCSPFDPGSAPYKRTHFNHPCALWVRQSRAHFLWLVAHAKGIFGEWQKISKVQHKSFEVVLWAEANIEKLSFPTEAMQDFFPCVPDEYKPKNSLNQEIVLAYRIYYKNEKKFAAWTFREKPFWMDRDLYS